MTGTATQSLLPEQLLLCLENWITVFKHKCSWLFLRTARNINATGLSGSLIPSNTPPFQLQSSLFLFTLETWDFVTSNHKLYILFSGTGICYLSQLRVCRVVKSHNLEISSYFFSSRAYREAEFLLPKELVSLLVSLLRLSAVSITMIKHSLVFVCVLPAHVTGLHNWCPPEMVELWWFQLILVHVDLKKV